MEFVGYQLCRAHLKWITGLHKAGKTAKIFYFELKSLGIPAILEYHDGMKTVDIAIPAHKIFIEIDGIRQYKSRKAMRELFRNFYAWENNMHTIHIPRSIVKCPETLVESLKFISFILNRNEKLTAVRKTG
jgi:hypothetical protein